MAKLYKLEKTRIEFENLEESEREALSEKDSIIIGDYKEKMIFLQGFIVSKQSEINYLKTKVEEQQLEIEMLKRSSSIADNKTDEVEINIEDDDIIDLAIIQIRELNSSVSKLREKINSTIKNLT